MNQTFMSLIRLFKNSDIPAALFSTFLPNEPIPSTEFLSDSVPTAPPTVPTVTDTADPNVSTDPTGPTSTVSTDSYYTDPNSGGVGIAVAVPHFVFFCFLVAVLACSMLALLL